MFQRPVDVATREYEFLRRREGADFFLALRKYVDALLANRRIKKLIRVFEREVEEASQRTTEEQVELV
jgi:hypothetical protein